MTHLSDLANAQPLIGRYWNQNPPPEQARILSLARDALDFIFATGQRYPFEGHTRQPDYHGPPPQVGSPELNVLMDEARRFFEHLRDAPESGEEVAQTRLSLF